MAIAFGMLVRFALASAFVASAGWKLRDRRAFRVAFRGLAPEGLRPFAKFAVWPVAVTEIGVAAVLVAGLEVKRLATLGALVAVGFVGLFSFLIMIARDLESCGCWSMPFVATGDEARRLLVARNALLLGYAVAALALPAEFGPAAVSAIPAGALLALLTMEVPQIASAATFHRTWMPGE